MPKQPLEKRQECIISTLSNYSVSLDGTSPVPQIWTEMQIARQSVEYWAMEINGEGYWRWSEAITHESALAVYQALAIYVHYHNYHEPAVSPIPLRVLELGSFRGISLAYIARVLSSFMDLNASSFTSVDPYFSGEDYNTVDLHYYQTDDRNSFNRCRKLCQDGNLHPDNLACIETSKDYKAARKMGGAMAAAFAIYEKFIPRKVGLLQNNSIEAFPILLEDIIPGGRPHFDVIFIDGSNAHPTYAQDVMMALANY